MQGLSEFIVPCISYLPGIESRVQVKGITHDKEASRRSCTGVNVVIEYSVGARREVILRADAKIYRCWGSRQHFEPRR